MIAAVLAAMLLGLGALAVYLTAPHQAVLATPAGKRVRGIGVVALVAALACLLAIMGPATAVFTWATGLMLLWSVPTVGLGFWRYRRNSQP